MADPQLVDHLPGDHQPVPAVGGRRIGHAPAAMVGDLAFQYPVITKGGPELNGAGSVSRVGVLNGVGDDLGDGQLQIAPALGGRGDLVQPLPEGMPDLGHAR